LIHGILPGPARQRPRPEHSPNPQGSRAGRNVIGSRTAAFRRTNALCEVPWPRLGQAVRVARPEMATAGPVRVERAVSRIERPGTAGRLPEAPVGWRLCCLPEHADGLTPFCKVCRRLLPDGVHACVTPGRC